MTMTPEQFAYWLQGFVELGKGEAPTPEQWKSIREHLDTVFMKVTPPVVDAPKKSESLLERAVREMRERESQHPSPPFGHYPFIPPMQQPHWLQPGPGVTYPVNPMTVTC
jgi:hypothetical protein